MSRLEAVLNDVLRWARPAWEALARCLDTLWHRAVSLWSEIRDRHERLMDTDPRYPVALAAGGGAVVKVLIANPAVVKALTVLFTDLLGDPDRRREITPPAYRPSSPWPSSQGGSSLWDRDDWDDE